MFFAQIFLLLFLTESTISQAVQQNVTCSDDNLPSFCPQAAAKGTISTLVTASQEIPVRIDNDSMPLAPLTDNASTGL